MPRSPRVHAAGTRSPAVPVLIALTLLMALLTVGYFAVSSFNAALDEADEGRAGWSFGEQSSEAPAPRFADGSSLTWMTGLPADFDWENMWESMTGFQGKGYRMVVCKPNQGLRYELASGGNGYVSLSMSGNRYSFPVDVGFLVSDDGVIDVGASDPGYPNLGAALSTCFSAAAK